MKRLETRARIIDIKITFQCNNLCRFCVAGDKRQAFADIPFEKVQEILRSNSGDRKTVVFTGGEPTIRKDLFELVRFARDDCGYSTVVIQTNGRRLAYKDYASALAASGANQFAVSLHGHNAALHDYLTKRPGSFGETLLGIKNLLDLGLTVATNTVITKSGHFNLPEIAKLLVTLGVRQMQFAFPHIEGKARASVGNIVPLMTLLSPNLHRAIDTASDASRIALTEGIPACILKGKEDHAVENLMTKRKVIDEQGDIDDFDGHRMSRLKAKGPECHKCRHYDICEGPWADYPELFTWKEFHPVP